MRADISRQALAHGGIGSPSYICNLQIMGTISDMKPVVVPFTGAGQALTSVIRGDVWLCALTADALGQIIEGNVKAIASTAKVPQLPNLKTAAEQGFPSIDTTVTNGIIFPKGTPDELVDAFTRARMEVMKDPTYQSDTMALGLTVIPLADDATARSVREQHARAYLEELSRYSKLLGRPIAPSK